MNIKTMQLKQCKLKVCYIETAITFLLEKQLDNVLPLVQSQTNNIKIIRFKRSFFKEE